MRDFLQARWRRWSLLGWLHLSVGLVLLLASLLLLLTTARNEAADIREDLRQVLAQKLRTLPATFQEPVITGDYASIEELLRLHAMAPEILRLTFTDSRGTSVHAMGRHDSSALTSLLENVLGVEDVSGQVPIIVGGRIYGEFLVEVGSSRLVARLGERLGAQAALLLPALLLSYLLLWVVVRRALAPLHALEQATAALAVGELQEALPVQGSREIQHVVSAFNVMAAQMRTSQLQVLEREALLRAMLNGSRHFAGLLDPDGRMLLVNDTALLAADARWEDLAGRPFVDGPWWQSADYRARLVQALEQARQGRTAGFEMVFRQHGEERVIDFSIRPLFDGQGRLLHLVPEGIDITARQRAVTAMEAVHRRFQSVFAAANVGIVLTDAAGVTLECNQTLLEMLELSRAELVGRRFDSITHPDDWEREQAGVLQMVQSGAPYFRTEKRYLTLSGKEVWADLVVSAIRDADGSVLNMVGVASDITIRKQAEALARNASRMQRRLLDNSAVGILLCSDNRDIIEVNAHAGRMFGYTPAELVGQNIRLLHLDTEHFESFAKYYEGLRQGHEQTVVEYPYRRRDGSTLWCAVSGAPMDPADRNQGIIWTLLDITERRQADQARLVSEERLSLALEGAGLGLWDWHVPSGRLEFNARWAEMLGYRVDELAPEAATWEQLVHPADLPRAQERIAAFLRGEVREYHCEQRLLHRDGHWVWVLVTGRITQRDEAGSPVRVVGVHLDISANKTAELVVRSREQHLQALLSAMSDVVFLIDTAGRFSEFHWPAHTPYQPPQAEEFIGQDYNVFLPEAATEVVDQAIAQVMMENQPHSVELLLPLDGQERCFHATFSLLVDNAGYPQGFLCVARDITERKAEEAAAAAARREIERLSQRNELLLNSAGDGIFGVALDGTCTFINPAALEMLGYTREQVIGSNQHELFHHHRPDGSGYPVSECPVYLTLHDGERRETEEVFLHRDGQQVPVHLTVTPMRESGALIGAEVVFQDISLRKAMEQELLRLATTDSLTGLPNRRHFMEQLGHELARIKRFGKPACLLMLDLDHFKRVNDTYGHGAGDTVLRHFARLADEQLREVDLIGRLGGEEFGVLLPGTALPGAQDLAERLRLAVCAEPVRAGEHAIPVTVSIGIAEVDPADPEPDDILARADVALYQAKETGRNRVCCQ